MLTAQYGDCMVFICLYCGIGDWNGGDYRAADDDSNEMRSVSVTNQPTNQSGSYSDPMTSAVCMQQKPSEGKSNAESWYMAT